MGGGERRQRHPRGGCPKDRPATSGAHVGGAAGTQGTEVDQQQLAWQLAQQGGPAGWDTLPHSALEKVFNHLELRDLAAAATVCSTWRYEASLDARWKGFWQEQVSDVGLWRWAKADGGYRQQLRAKQLVRRGECVASVFPFSRRDGPVTEVLFFDGGRRDADKRILSVQAPKAPGHSVRLLGSTLKVWDARALMAQRPLLVVHDVLKHMQLESGLLFLWRIADDATILTSGVDVAEPDSEVRRWTEHPAIVPSVLEPAQLELRDVPLEASYGRGVTPCEWLDMSGGLVAGSLMVPSQGRLLMRLFDLGTGRCLRASWCPLPEEEHALQLQDHEISMIVTRSCEAGSLVVTTCALFDTRVFLWRLRDEWIAAGQAAAAAAAALAAAPGGTASSQSEEQRQAAAAALAAARAACWDPAAAPAVAAGALAASPAAAGAVAPPADADPGSDADSSDGDDAGGGAGPSQRGRAQYELRHVYSTPDQEPIVDISISSTRHCLFIIGMESIFVADLAGTPYMRVSTLAWRGVVPEGQATGPADVGAFSWPLPNSTKTAFYLDTTHSLFIAEFRRPQMSDYWFMAHTQQGPPGRHPRFDHHVATALGPGGEAAGQVSYYVQSHTDLRPPPPAQTYSTQHGRAAGPRACEPGIVEYSQDGGVLFTTADARCPAVASLLALERSAGTYLAGLGPGSAPPRSGCAGCAAPFVSRPGRGKGPLAPRALVLVDTSSGCRFKAVPIEGSVESVHSAGQYLVAAVTPAASFPEGLNGALVVLDFGGAGFGCQAEAAEAAAGGSRSKAGRRKQQQDAARRQRAPGTKAGKVGKRKQRQEQGRQQRKQQAASPKTSGRRGKASASDDEPGPRKRGRR